MQTVDEESCPLDCGVRGSVDGLKRHLAKTHGVEWRDYYPEASSRKRPYVRDKKNSAGQVILTIPGFPRPDGGGTMLVGIALDSDEATELAVRLLRAAENLGTVRASWITGSLGTLGPVQANVNSIDVKDGKPVIVANGIFAAAQREIGSELKDLLGL